MVKSLFNHIHLVEHFFSFHIDTAKDLEANLDIVNHLVLSLASCKVTFSYEHNVVILLNSLSNVYKKVKMILNMEGMNYLLILL